MLGLLKSFGQFSRIIQGIKYLKMPGHGSSTLIPADFLINKDQTIHTAYYGNDISDHIPLRQIELFLKE